MIQSTTFLETSPSSAITAASSNPVTGASASYLPAGIAGPFDDYDSIDVLATFGGKTAAGASTGGTVDLFLQVSPDGGITWRDAVHFTQAAANSAAKTFSASLTNRGQATVDTPIQVGVGTTTVLGANALAQGLAFDRVRLLMTAGAGTNAGAPVTVLVTGHRARIREV